jgi:hypothetical protein
MTMKLRVEDQRLLVVKIRGLLRRKEFEKSERASVKMIQEVGKLTALILLDEFRGWEPADQWGQIGFLMQHDSDIAKIAIVGEEKWRDEVLAFAGVGLRRSAVRYFNDAESARAWLAENAA